MLTRTTPRASVKELAAYIYASCVDTAFKLYKEGSAEHNKALEIAQRPEVSAIRGCRAFREHHRCEPNYGLDSWGAVRQNQRPPRPALLTSAAARAKMLLAKRAPPPKPG